MWWEGKPLRSRDKTINAWSVLKAGSLNIISRTWGPDWSWCWSSRRTSCSGWPRTACCACWGESAGWPSQGAPPVYCPPRKRLGLQARSQLSHLDLALLSKDLKTTSLVRPKPVLGVNFHLRERYVPGNSQSRGKFFLHLTIFANGRLVFGESSRDDLIKNAQVKYPPGLKSPAAEKTNKVVKSPAQPERGQPGGNESKELAQAIGKALEKKFSVH